MGVFDSRDFDDILRRRTLGHQIYQGCPLSTVSPSRRGYIIEDLVRSALDASGSFGTSQDAQENHSIAGGRLGRQQASYDWLQDGRRVECKSCLMSYNNVRSIWVCQFGGV